MSCSAYQDLILESLDGPLAAPSRAQVEQHVAGCPACRAFRQAQLDLDAALALRLRAPSLSAAFDAQVLARIQQAAATADREAKLAMAQAEYESRLADLRQSFRRRRFGSALDLAGYAAMVLLAGFTASTIVPRLWAQFTKLPAGLGNDPGFLAACFLAVLVTGGGFLLAAKRPWLGRLTAIGR
jgi:anti-sigma factor RsiW